MNMRQHVLKKLVGHSKPYNPRKNLCDMPDCQRPNGDKMSPVTFVADGAILSVLILEKGKTMALFAQSVRQSIHRILAKEHFKRYTVFSMSVFLSFHDSIRK